MGCENRAAYSNIRMDKYSSHLFSLHFLKLKIWGPGGVVVPGRAFDLKIARSGKCIPEYEYDFLHDRFTVFWPDEEERYHLETLIIVREIASNNRYQYACTGGVTLQPTNILPKGSIKTLSCVMLKNRVILGLPFTDLCNSIRKILKTCRVWFRATLHFCPNVSHIRWNSKTMPLSLPMIAIQDDINGSPVNTTSGHHVFTQVKSKQDVRPSNRFRKYVEGHS
ncbi:hypothetical protein GQR58_005585 [Nymphon striatum]|nr:hypothetical protein GQR58_005585 [Nymphon striatum]